MLYPRTTKAPCMNWRFFRIVVIIPTLFLVTIALTCLAMGEASASQGYSQIYRRYTTVAGFFLQDEESTDPTTFDYASSNLGLIDRSYPSDADFDIAKSATQWQRFEHYVDNLNRNSRGDENYKVLIMGRHGEGYHNVAQDFYGTEAWDCHWSMLDGNGTISWDDARLTDKGMSQALVANAFWKKALEEDKIPAPQSYYSSPLDRCIATSYLTFEDLDLPPGRPFKPLIKELLREALGVHTCDRRSTKSEIHKRWPAYDFESGFAEDDPLWESDVRESDSHITARLKTLFDDIFSHDGHTFISLTAHSGAIAGALRALGHRSFGLQTGGVIPVLVKVEIVHGQEPATSIAPGTPAPTTCSINPTPSA